MKSMPARSPLAILVTLGLVSLALYLLFFVAIPALDRFLELMANCYDRFPLIRCIAGFLSYME